MTMRSLFAKTMPATPSPSDVVRHDFRTGDQATVFRVEDTATGMCFLGSDERLLTSSCHGRIQLWSDSGTVEDELSYRGEPFGGLARSRGGHRIVAVHYGNPTSKLRLIDASSGTLKEIASVNADGLEWGISVAFSDDEELIAIGGIIRGLQLWKWPGRKLLEFESQSDLTETYGLAFTADDRFLVSCGNDQTVRVWNTKTGKLVRTLRHFDDLFAVYVGPNGRVISGGAGRQLHFWNWESGRRLGSISVEAPSIRRIRATPDRANLVTAHADGTIRVHPLTSRLDK